MAESARGTARAIGVGVVAVLAGTCALRPQPSRVPLPAAVAQEQIFARIQDGSTGLHWVLLRAAKDSPGPGRWVQMGREPSGEVHAMPGKRQERSLVILAGDRLVIQEQGAHAAVHLEAVALEPAAAGARLRIRLQAGDAVLEAVALSAGRAALIAKGWAEQ